jgi:CO/xanthine dehydrogenase FAD-binding subunit
MLPEFEFWRPQSLAEALARLAEHGPEVMPVAGGTNVIADLRGGRHRPKALLDLNSRGVAAGLRGIRRENGQVIAGAGTTITQLLHDPLAAGTPLAQAAAVFANPLVRNRATVGGNLVDASPAADTAPPLLAMDAVVDLRSAAGTRCVPLADFLTGVRQTTRRPDELLVAVRWPVPEPRSAGAFYKVGLRKSDAISVLSVAVSLAVDEAGLCRDARIALGAVAPRPLRAYEAEAVLNGRAPTPALLAEAACLAGEAARPIGDIRGSAAYRRRVTETVTRRLLVHTAAECERLNIEGSTHRGPSAPLNVARGRG